MIKDKEICFAFYTGIGGKEPLLNRITSYFTGKYMHCEILFASSLQHEACGIYQNETCFMRPKRFMKSCWEFIALSVTRRQYNIMHSFCKEQAIKKVPFNTMGFYRCITPFPRKTDGDSWFCSELITTCLQAAHLLIAEIPSASTPSSLYHALLSIGAFKTSAPEDLVTKRMLTLKRKKLGRWF